MIITSAFLIVLMPLLGFPRSWEPKVLLLLGGIIIVIELYAVLSRAQDAFFRDYEVNTDVYTERIQKRETFGSEEKENDLEIVYQETLEISSEEESSKDR